MAADENLCRVSHTWLRYCLGLLQVLGREECREITFYLICIAVPVTGIVIPGGVRALTSCSCELILAISRSIIWSNTSDGDLKVHIVALIIWLNPSSQRCINLLNFILQKWYVIWYLVMRMPLIDCKILAWRRVQGYWFGPLHAMHHALSLVTEWNVYIRLTRFILALPSDLDVYGLIHLSWWYVWSFL